MAVLGTLLSLGFWQLDRADQKRVMLVQQQHMMVGGELLLNARIPDDLSLLKYRPVSVAGHFEGEHQFLIDNQHANGKVGYFVLTPFRLVGTDKAVLVNRGWLPLNVDRTKLPSLPISAAPMTLNGRVNSFPSVGIKLAGAEIPTKTWPAVVQVAEASVLAKSLGYPLFSFQIELDPAQPEGFLRVWQPASIMPPEQHVAYAVQWFGLALTFTVLFFWFNFKKTA
ncbi:MAG: SURF1 family protein [Methylococcaceae bacterium]|nr:SURF1 family protein [Methylococcaceae bacterium]